jgi:hypothetical protein
MNLVIETALKTTPQQPMINSQLEISFSSDSKVLNPNKKTVSLNKTYTLLNETV